MRVVFIQPRGRGTYTICPEPPLGLAYLAASLLRYRPDIDIEIIDGFMLGYDDYLEEISKVRADLVGVTSTMSLLSEALKIPGMVRDKGIRFIIGGPGVGKIEDARLYESGYSVLCRGEGEETIVDLVRAQENSMPLEGVRGISFISDGREVRTPDREPPENLDDLPRPARHLLDMKEYMRIWKEKMGFSFGHIVSSRGCPYSCSFCDRTTFGGKIRYTSSRGVIDEMRELYERYGADMVYFEDELFTLNRKRVMEICDVLERDLPGRIWGAMARVESVDPELLRRMKEAGCRELSFGVESGSQRMLDLLGKGTTVDQIRKAFHWVNEVGISGGMYLIVGVPGEAQEDIDMTKRLIEELGPKLVNVFYLTPYPGTEIYEMTKHLIREDADFYNYNDTFESVYRKEVFEVQPSERVLEVMSFFLDTFKGEIDPRLSIEDGSALESR